MASLWFKYEKKKIGFVNFAFLENAVQFFFCFPILHLTKSARKIVQTDHACQTSQADILHLDQKAVKSTTGKRVCGKF